MILMIFGFSIAPNFVKYKVLFIEKWMVSILSSYIFCISFLIHFVDILISPGVIRRPIRNTKSPRTNIPKEVIVLDDDYPRNERRYGKKHTSTPGDMLSREDDEIKFVGEYRASDKKQNSQRDRIVRPQSLFSNILMDRTNGSNNTKLATSKFMMNGNGHIDRRQPLTSYTTRLDDKREFQNLLDNHLESSLNNSSLYFTPNSRLSKYDFSSRGRKILELSRQNSRNNSVGHLIDLTNEDQNGSTSSGKLSVKDKIKKVLSSFDDEPVEIQDSESDVEILPRPPTPKPDIKVEPINSFKKIVDTSYVSNQKWLVDV